MFKRNKKGDGGCGRWWLAKTGRHHSSKVNAYWQKKNERFTIDLLLLLVDFWFTFQFFLQFRDTAPMVVIAPHRWFYIFLISDTIVNTMTWAPSFWLDTFAQLLLGYVDPLLLRPWARRHEGRGPKPPHLWPHHQVIWPIGETIRMVYLFRFMQTVSVDRSSSESRRATVKELRRRTTEKGWPRWSQPLEI